MYSDLKGFFNECNAKGIGDSGGCPWGLGCWWMKPEAPSVRGGGNGAFSPLDVSVRVSLIPGSAISHRDGRGGKHTARLDCLQNIIFFLHGSLSKLRSISPYLLFFIVCAGTWELIRALKKKKRKERRALEPVL